MFLYKPLTNNYFHTRIHAYTFFTEYLYFIADFIFHIDAHVSK